MRFLVLFSCWLLRGLLCKWCRTEATSNEQSNQCMCMTKNTNNFWLIFDIFSARVNLSSKINVYIYDFIIYDVVPVEKKMKGNIRIAVKQCEIFKRNCKNVLNIHNNQRLAKHIIMVVLCRLLVVRLVAKMRGVIKNFMIEKKKKQWTVTHAL